MPIQGPAVLTRVIMVILLVVGLLSLIMPFAVRTERYPGGVQVGRMTGIELVIGYTRKSTRINSNPFGDRIGGNTATERVLPSPLVVGFAIAGITALGASICRANRVAATSAAVGCALLIAFIMMSGEGRETATAMKDLFAKAMGDLFQTKDRVVILTPLRGAWIGVATYALATIVGLLARQVPLKEVPAD